MAETVDQTAEESPYAALLLPTLCLLLGAYILQDSRKRGKPISWYVSLQFVDEWLGLTPEQYKGIGKYLKPWGKPPTRATFWVQILTTVVVIIISIGKAVESLRDPTFLTFAIVGVLFGLVLLAGYIKAKREQMRQIAEEEAAAAADTAGPRRREEEEDEDDEDDEDRKKAEAARARAQAEAQARAQAMAQQQAQARARAEAQAKQAQEQAAREAEVAKEVAAVRGLMNKRVRIDGLASKPELNGKFGKTTRYFSDKGRFAVQVEGSADSDEQLLLKPGNLTPVSDDGSVAESPDAGPPPLS